MKKRLFFVLSLLIILSCSDDNEPFVPPDDNIDNGNGGQTPPEVPLPTGFTPCNDGIAGVFPCQGIDFLGLVSLSEMTASSGNDIWGWTDPSTLKEYAIVGLDNGTAFVDISDNEEFLYLGKLPTATTSSNWRDIKVYENHAFIVSEAAGHGMQVFDLTELRNVSSIPVIFDAVTRYTGFGNAHNIVINEESGYAYVVGTNRNDLYSGGAHFIDIKDPINPIAAGGYGDSGYSHDAHVVNYFGPDPDYMGRELMVGANENQITIVDVTNKDNPQLVNSFGYNNIGYTHQGWFTENQRYFILGDELDELNFGFDSRTLIFDLSDLDNPILHSTYIGPTAAIDHNGYVIDNEFYLANYTAGIRILDLADIDEQPIVEKAYFDTYLQNDNAVFEGVWSLYPFFESGKIIVNDINSGLFVLAKSN